MKNSNRVNHNKILDIDVITNLLNHELRTSKIIGPTTTTNNIHFKILIPCMVAGAIIGKGGESISVVQKETGTRIKISKSYEFYPGTTERICLIIGTVESVTRVHNYIIEKIQERSDHPSRKPDIKGCIERYKQVKILVPNSTAGMIIGKSGCYIKEIKDKTGSFIQVSQKSKEINLSERCVTIAGEKSQNRLAVDLILEKISEDPHSASCPLISYVDILGPVASAYPNGSPYALLNNSTEVRSSTTSPILTYSNTNSLNSNYMTPPNQMEQMYSSNDSINYSTFPPQSSDYSSNLLSMIPSNSNYLTPPQSPVFFSNEFSDYQHQFNQDHVTQSITSNQTTFYYTNDPNPIEQIPIDDTIFYPLADSSALDVVRNILRLSGFSDLSTESISKAIETICKYGLTNQNLNTIYPTNHNSSLRTSNNNITLYNSFPLYNTTTLSSNTTSTTNNATSNMANTSLNPQEEFLTTNCPLEFLIQSYLTQVAIRNEVLVSPVTSLDSLKMVYGDGEETSRNIVIGPQKMEYFGMDLQSPVIKHIKSKTKTDIKLDYEASRIAEGLFSLKVSSKNLDDILDAIGEIIYCNDSCNLFTGSKQEQQNVSQYFSNTNNCQ